MTPQLALASPYARAGVWAQAATQPDPNDPMYKPTSSKAPKSQEQEFPDKPEPPPEVKPEPVPEPAAPPPDGAARPPRRTPRRRPRRGSATASSGG